MLRQHWKLINHLERLGDNFVIVVAFFCTYYLRNIILTEESRLIGTLPKAFSELGPLEDYFVILILGIPLFNAILSLLGAYRSMRFMSYLTLAKLSLFASLVVFLCIGSFLYALKLDLSRSFVGIFCAFCFVGILFERLATLRLLRYFRLRGKNFRNVLIVGEGSQARKLFLEIVKRPELGIRVKGFVMIQGVDGERMEIKNPRIHALRAHSEIIDLPSRIVANEMTFERALKRYAIDEVLFTDVVGVFDTIQGLAEIAVEEGIQVSLAADIFSLEIFRSDISYFGNIPLIHFEPSPAGMLPLMTKRLIDMVISSTAIIAVSPILLITAIAIKIDSPGPIFFRQRRVGLNGRIFTLLKFRSMVEKAHSMLGELKSFNEMKGPAFKMSNDPRVTRVGAFIRKYSIDELPQLINVLKGDMSLVGPRPPIPSEVARYRRKQRRRLSMRPGLTCTWQVAGRNKIVDFDEWAKMDLKYIDNWSLLGDLKLLIKTIPAVLSGSGAK